MFAKVESIRTVVVDGANEWGRICTEHWEYYQALYPADYKRNTQNHMSHRLTPRLTKNLTKNLGHPFRLLLYGGYNIDGKIFIFVLI